MTFCMTLDGEPVRLREHASEEWTGVLHALPDLGCGVISPARYLADFVAFFSELAEECQENSLRLAALMADLQLIGRETAVMTITLTGDRGDVERVLHRWGEFLWERGPLFARRNPVVPLHVPLSLPFDNPMLSFFPFVRHVVPWFNPALWAQTTILPFATYHDRRGMMLATTDVKDHNAAAIHSV